MKSIASFLIPFFFLAAAPAQAEQKKFLSCSGHSVWLDVDTQDRTRVQLVSRDLAVNRYLLGDLQVQPKSNRGEGFEVVLGAHQPSGVFRPADFEQAIHEERVQFAKPRFIQGEAVVAYREIVVFRALSPDLVQLRITRHDLVKCVGNTLGPDGQCEKGTYLAEHQNVGDWVFSGCRATEN